MLPAFFSTVMTPFATVQPAGLLSRVLTHSPSDLPSKSTMASEGGAAGLAPGVTTGGTGVHCSVSCGLGWHMADVPKSVSAARPSAHRASNLVTAPSPYDIPGRGTGWRQGRW